ncbi:MAG: ATP-binding protein [Saprospiraceae bacterium]
MDTPKTPIIGKDVIESLTLGMYEDSKFIFREYVQNAADAIDKAVSLNLIEKKDAAIHLIIDPAKHLISIEDNGTGISRSEVSSILRNIAQSTKQRGVDKGFRGIGRLGGLAYCKKLIFETSFKGEDTKSILVWNAGKLKDLINNRAEKEEAAQVIELVTEVVNQAESNDAHYFKVTLEGVSSPELLNEQEIRHYLELVAPLPFHASRFAFKSKIYEELEKDGLYLDEYMLYLGNGKEPGEQLFKPYKTIVHGADNHDPEDIMDIVFLKEKDKSGQFLFWGWYGIRARTSEQIKPINRERGIRLRQSNIQIGLDNALQKLYGKDHDQRFHYYFVGEIHAFNKTLIPNARRDYFVENAVCYEMETALKSEFHQLKRLCYKTSEVNSSVRAIQNFEKASVEFEQKQLEGAFLNKEEQQRAWYDLESRKHKATEAAKKIEKTREEVALGKSSEHLSSIMERLVGGEEITKVAEAEMPTLVTKPAFVTDQMARLPKDQRKLLSRVFEVIHRVLDKNTADNLVQKIIEELR